ncbi:MAG: stage V sporulation protein R [Phycisphaeraceae bacterium]|nr:MAG: stage V sporulation protein R [Phycisphaeraceae bacterium]
MPPTTHNTDLTPELRAHMERIKAKATELGLDFFEVVFEMLDFDTMNQIAAYGGFPIRYPHWRWGMEYEKLSKRDAYGMGRIYEMVINNDPSYAYLQESNSVTDQKLVMAHVYGHSDFFKCNFWFSQTDRHMIDHTANHATRVRRHIERQGHDTVERFIDDCLALEHLIDPHSAFVARAGEGDDPGEAVQPERLPAKDYMDRFINPAAEMDRQQQAIDEKAEAERARFPRRPTRDVLLFLLRHAKLEDWQADILGIVRDEAYYFAPQGMTKVMNEGWATYWHSKMMTEHFLEDAEIIDYAEQHSGVVHMAPGGFNPYKIGVELFKDIERRWDRGQHGPEWERLGGIGERGRFDDGSMKGRDKIFEIRRIYNDVNFIDEFLTPEFVERHRMYQHARDPKTGEVKVVSRDFDRVKKTLLYHLTNMGQPFIHVADANYLNRGELYLAHEFNGFEVDAEKGEGALHALRRVWGRPVHLQAVVNEEMALATLGEPDGEITRQKISDDTPPPAHQIM